MEMDIDDLMQRSAKLDEEIECEFENAHTMLFDVATATFTYMHGEISEREDEIDNVVEN